MVGEDAEKSTAMLRNVRRPIEDRLFRDWDYMEQCWQHAFSLLDVEANETAGVILTESPTNTQAAREKLATMMFEKFDVPKLYITTSALMAVYASQKTTGVVVDNGHHAVHVVPVIDGVVQRNPIQESK